MLEDIERYIRTHASSWDIDPAPSDRLHAVLRANPENDGVVREFQAGQIGTVVFWFRPGDRKPFIVSKLVGAGLTEEAIAECKEIQEAANRSLGRRLFPAIHGVADIAGTRIVMMEAAEGANYEIQLARAVAGPERSKTAFLRVVTTQLQELGAALRGLRAHPLSTAQVSWGDRALGQGRRFLERCPEARDVLGEQDLADMARRIDTLRWQTQFVLTEDYLANYLSGPCAVDQLVPGIRDLCERWPGPVSGLRILIAYFRASPMHCAYVDYSWPDTLAACIAGDSRVGELATPVRRFLDDIGLGASSPSVVWAYVMGAFLLRSCEGMDYRAGKAAAEKLRVDLLHRIRDLVRIDKVLANPAAGKIAGLSVTGPDERHLDGEFIERDRADYFSFPALASSIPKWVAALSRLQHGLRIRHPALYDAVRSIYRLPAAWAGRRNREPR